MAYVSVAEWRPEQVTEWLKGLDNCIVSYIHWFSNNEVNGQQLLNLSPDELTHLGVYKLGHQELILEAVQHLRNFHYELDRENLQLLALKLSCAAHSLYSEIKDQGESSSVPTQIMADVANVIHYVKPLVSWLDRPPFAGQLQYSDFKSQLLSLSLEMATSAQRDRFADRPVAEIRTCSSKLAKLADSILQDVTDPMILQPATLDLATIKKKAGEDLDFFLVPSFHGIHQIGDMKLSSPAHQSGKIQQGDEIVQVNYQTVVGWSRKKVLALFEESPNDLLLTLKRRPRHVKMYGQIYIKPYRLPSRKRASPYSRWNDNLPSPRPELLTIPYFDISRTTNLPKKGKDQILSLVPSGTSSSSDEEFGQPSDSQSPASMRLYLPKPRASIQRRFTLSGPPRPSAQSEQFWRELQLERSWRSNQNNAQMSNNSSVQNMGSKEGNIDEMFQLRDKSASFGNSIASASSRSTTCVPFTKDRIGSVKFDLTKFDSIKNDSVTNDKTVGEEKDKAVSDISSKAASSEVNHGKNEDIHDQQPSRTLDLTAHTSLSITELNKLKRDAFFNNMDCQNVQSDTTYKNGKEGSSEKVKRVIENFKTEINKTKRDMSEVDILKSPGKVMELVENFERKETVNSQFKNKLDFQGEKMPTFTKTGREKGRLDKSCSAPAYDTTEDSDSKIDFLGDSKENQGIFSNKNTLEKNKYDSYTNEYKKDTQEEIINPLKICTIPERSLCEKNLPSKEEDYKKIKDKGAQYKEEINHSVARNNDKKSEDSIYIKSQNMRQFLETVNTISEVKQMDQTRIDGKSDKNNASTESGASSHSISLNKVEEPPKPIPAQRKSKLTPEKTVSATGYSNPGPLPPKPRSKLPSPENTMLVPPVVNKLPPEPPPRPDSTFLKPIPEKKISVDSKEHEDTIPVGEVGREVAQNSGTPSRKGNVVISAPIPLAPGSFPNEMKPLSAAGSPTTRKLSKSLNTNPSGSTPPVTTEKEKPKSSGSTLESLKAMLTLGRKPAFNSPRSVRKKNAMLAKKRNVSVKEIIPYENAGFLWHRNRKGSAVASWTKYYFVIQGSNFYGFKSKESHKADLFIHLPGFTCTLADEVKSKEFSFKIYHTGTVFYFAANSGEDLQQWLDCVNVATSFQDDKSQPEAVTFSQTDSDASDSEPEPETCFPTSPKMKKVLGSSPVPKPARSHQNLASESKKTHETQKRFGSLKKLSSSKSSSSNNYFSGSCEPSTEVASLDRKYLRFLGQKNSPIPVPTSRFRSYRRMQPTPAIPPKGKPKVKSENVENNTEAESSQANNRDPPRLIRKPLHSSNPSLIHPHMADYRVTQERLTEFRRLRIQSGAPDVNRFVTLEQFLQRGQEENFRPNRNRPPEMSGFMTLEQFLLLQEEERQRSNRLRERPAASSNDFNNPEPSLGRNEEEILTSNTQNKIRVAYPGQSSPSTSSQNVVTRPKKMELDKPQVPPRSRAFASNVPGQLKNVAMYQPPPIPHSSSTSSQGEDSIVFEMALDQNESRKTTTSKSSEGESSRVVECNHMSKSNCTDYPGIEYPPAFEPETYTLQHMLKNRQKRDSEQKK